MEGWVCIHRQIMEHPDYFAEPFTRMGAWIDLLLLARHDVGYIRVRGTQVRIERGQVCLSQRTMAARWQWSRGKVYGFLKNLEADGMIETQKGSVIDRITIVNYDIYQHNREVEGIDVDCDSGGLEKRPQKRPLNGPQNKVVNDYSTDINMADGVDVRPQKRPQTEPQKDQNNNDNNNTHTVVSNNNLVTDKTRARARRMLEWVAANFPDVAAMPKPFTEEQAMVLLGKYSEEDIMRIISDMDNKGATGNMSAYASFNAFAERDTLLTRRREDQTKLYTYDEVCAAVTRGLRFDDFTITGTKRHGQNLWRRRQDGS